MTHGDARLGRRGFTGGLLLLAGAAGVTRPAAAQDEDRQILIRDLYAEQMEFSERALALAGGTVEVPGFMAPPLKPDIDFFVLTRLPLSVCPFCDAEADWPRDIVVVKLVRRWQAWVNFNVPIMVTGTLELGTEVDEATGFVSRVRITQAAYETT